MEDLPAHLMDVAAEVNGDIEERLGSPAIYAAELRAAAGIEPSRPSIFSPTAGFLADRLRHAWASWDVRLGQLLGYDRLSGFVHLLRPAWWVIRGYIVAMFVLAIAFRNSRLLPSTSSGDGGLPAAFLGWTITLVFIAGSVRLGQRSDALPPLTIWTLRLGGAVLAGVTAIIVLNVNQTISEPWPGDSAYGDSPESTISDIYVYDSNGNPLTGVQLFDQDGNPIALGDPYRCRAEETLDPITDTWDLTTNTLDSISDTYVYPLCPVGPEVIATGPTTQTSGTTTASTPAASTSASSGAPAPSATPSS